LKSAVMNDVELLLLFWSLIANDRLTLVNGALLSRANNQNLFPGF